MMNWKSSDETLNSGAEDIHARYGEALSGDKDYAQSAWKDIAPLRVLTLQPLNPTLEWLQ
jgi:hypothetical protein